MTVKKLGADEQTRTTENEREMKKEEQSRDLIESAISEEADRRDSPLETYDCDDCGGQFVAKILRGPTEPMPHYYLAAGGGNPFVGSCLMCGGTMISRRPETGKEL